MEDTCRRTNVKRYFEIVRFLKRRKSVLDVSEKFGISETGTYFILKRLLDAGAIREVSVKTKDSISRGRPKKFYVANYIFVDCVDSNKSDFKRLLEEIRFRPMSLSDMYKFLNLKFRNERIKEFVNEISFNGIIEYRFPNKSELCTGGLLKSRKYAFFVNGGKAYSEFMES